MKLVYSHENQFIVGNIKNLIEAEEIKVFIKNEFAKGALGETAAFDCWPEVWVYDDGDYQKAIDVIALLEAKQAEMDWVCNQCDEKNDPSFEVCWHCKNEMPS
jgi:hypothetical protein